MGRSKAFSLLGLRAFEAAARRLSFTEAAEELHVSQAAVSRHVRNLEAELGTPLFRRLHRLVELTPAGHALSGDLAVGFLSIQRAVDRARGTATRRLRVSAEPAFASRWLAPRLRRFSAAHPDIELQLDSSVEMRTLGTDADVAIRYIPTQSRRRLNRGLRLFTIEGVPVVGATPRRLPRQEHDDSVIHHRLLHDDDGQAWRAWFNAAGLTGFEKARHQYFTDYLLTIEAAQHGHGAALGATAFLEAELLTGRLRQLGATRVTFGTYWLLEARDRASQKLRSAFTRWLLSELPREPAR